MYSLYSLYSLYLRRLSGAVKHALQARAIGGLAWRLRRVAQKGMELSEKHEPPCPSSQPRRPALKSPHGSRVDLDNLSGDDGSDMPLGEFPSSEAPHERLNPRRASWGDERGHGLKITHHGAPRRTLAPLPRRAWWPMMRDHRRTQTHTHTPTRAPACPCGSVRHPLQEELLPKTSLRDLLCLAPRVPRRHDRGGRAQLGWRALGSPPLAGCGHAECTRVVRVWRRSVVRASTSGAEEGPAGRQALQGCVALWAERRPRGGLRGGWAGMDLQAPSFVTLAPRVCLYYQTINTVEPGGHH